MFKLPIDKKVTGRLTGQDSEGNAAPLEGIVFTSSDEAVISIEQSAADPAECTVHAEGIGTAQFQALADARIGEGSVPLTAIETFEVVAAEAVSAGMSFGEPEPDTPPAP